MNSKMERGKGGGERIVAAAVRDSGVVYSVPRPKRHHHIFAEHCTTTPKGIVTCRLAGGDQGFLTNTGRFVDRKEAMRIAKTAGQVQRYSGPSDTLFTEDMW